MEAKILGWGTRTAAPLLLGGAILLAACSDLKRPTEATDPPSLSVEAATPAQATQRPGEEPFRQISESIPEFAGYFLEDDALVGLVTDMGRAASVRTALEPALNRPGVAAVVSRVEIRPAQYSFTQLGEWRDRAVDEVFKIADVARVDLDEMRNRLVIGLDDGSGRSTVRQKLAELDIPPNAIMIEVTGRTVLDVGVTAPIAEPVAFRRSHTLRNYRRPLEGGLEITGVGTCTLGFLARWGFPLQTVIVTVSHCSNSTMHPDNTAFYQALPPPGDGEWVGTEVHDPDHASRWWTPFRHGARKSDAAMVSVTGSTTHNIGYITRTTVRTGGDSASALVDVANPNMEIIGSEDYTMAGQTVDKIGRTTGWTYANVTSTCFDDVGIDNIVRQCSYAGNYGSSGGDSGAPVFIWHGNTVTLLGIHWGSGGVYSPLGGLRLDLGTFTFGALPSTPPPPTANITGPNEVLPESLCQWDGSASGGTPPYSYSWSGILSGSGSSILGSPSSSGVLKLTVTDAASQQDTHNRYVEVTSSAPGCVGGPG